MHKELKIFSSNPQTKAAIPLVSSPIEAGFPSPADDFIEASLDLNDLLIARPEATFFVRVQGQSMRDANIHPGDVLIVDRNLTPQNNSIIIAIVNGEFTVKRLRTEKDKTFLVPAHAQYPSIEIQKEWDFAVWGVVTYIIHKAR